MPPPVRHVLLPALVPLLFLAVSVLPWSRAQIARLLQLIVGSCLLVAWVV